MSILGWLWPLLWFQERAAEDASRTREFAARLEPTAYREAMRIGQEEAAARKAQLWKEMKAAKE